MDRPTGQGTESGRRTGAAILHDEPFGQHPRNTETGILNVPFMRQEAAPPTARPVRPVRTGFPNRARSDIPSDIPHDAGEPVPGTSRNTTRDDRRNEQTDGSGVRLPYISPGNRYLCKPENNPSRVRTIPAGLRTQGRYAPEPLPNPATATRGKREYGTDTARSEA